LADVACVVDVSPNGVVATFYVDDANTRRLLEGQADRLRASLNDRGLSQAAVRVVLGEPPQPFA
jgi:flagellar hook-length control protein FliK